MAQLGRVAFIANPAARSGQGAQAAERALALLRSSGVASEIDPLLTQRPGSAEELAAQTGSYDTLVVLGGDGTVHEAVNGLMQIECEKRPVFGLIPFGSGNDYAKTLGMPAGIESAVRALCTATPKRADLGCCNGRYFAETLSFGLDAQIALDTVRRRKRAGSSGLRLYAASSASQLLMHKREFSYVMRDEARRETTGTMLIFAVQVGPTYGSGFRICPDARIDDGLLDVCIGHAPISTPAATLLFLRAKWGKHTGAKRLELFQTSKLELHFSPLPAAQIDGEKLEGDTFQIHCEHNAITVLTRAGKR